MQFARTPAQRTRELYGDVVTMIITLVSANIVLQVSDRRISLLKSDGSIQLRDDLTNKAVLFCNRAVFAYTGMAHLQGKRTDLWLADRLVDKADLGDALADIRDDLTVLFQRRPNHGRRQTVTIGGFKIESDQSLTPYYAVISNCFQDGHWTREPLKKFSWLWEACPPHSRIASEYFKHRSGSMTAK